jgi:hypothetical protein
VTSQERHYPQPQQAPGGGTYTASLNWDGKDGVRHYGGGQLRPCRSCGRPALLVDDLGRPQHKVCAEYELERSLESGAGDGEAA